jgi:Transglycosylase SLT domain/FHA domain
MRAKIVDLRKGVDYPILREEFTIGRSTSSDIVCKQQYVSRNHCKITMHEGKYFVQDMKSVNGTYVNGMKINSQVELKNNDAIALYDEGPIFQFREISHATEANDYNIKNVFFNSKIRALFIILLIFIISTFVATYFISEGIIAKKMKYQLEKTITAYQEKDILLDKKIMKKLEYFINHYRKDKTLKEGLRNRFEFYDMMKDTFNKYNIPFELSFLAFVESNYEPEAYNQFSGARGMWQLMPDTAIQYGLKVNSKVDERTDPVKSTEAAVRYLKDLISVFGVEKLTIVIAAYNSGDAAVRNSLTQIHDPQKDRNFSYLYNNDLLPDETKDFVLKFIALSLLSREYEEKNKLSLKSYIEDLWI